MDPEKQKAYDAVKDKDNNGYDVNGIRCHTKAQVDAAWRDGPDAPAAVLPKGEKPPKADTK
ncbi:MAG: hypothetical protein QM754_18540 [Tepidisphaeraceae bacterium]